MNTTAFIVTHNNEATIDVCLRSLAAAGVPGKVVDNASTDQTVSIVRQHPVQFISQSRNKGFAAAANLGSSKHQSVSNKYFLFLNPDAVLETSLTPAVELLKSRPEVGIVGLGLYDGQGQPESDSFGPEPTLISLFTRKFLHQQRVTQRSTGPRSMKVRRLWSQGREASAAAGLAAEVVDWVSGGAMMVRSDVFRRLQGFDEQFFLYWEDIDLCRRARLAGFTVVRMSQVKVRHQRGASLGDTRQKAVLYDQSADRYFQKHYAASIWLIQRFLRRIYRWLRPHSR